ncbi:MAG TPA: FAD-dependent 5-carboxymethylaminomethyl-2-thiouridine(34) oxidoreductase MnmC [Caulobacteraceae bacterium]|jgi:tRNA 5-methylaminomethyl-2-thiouridine biosynthesis bifunctional protein
MNGHSPIDWSGGAPRSARFGDIYFSPDDGLAETRAVFLQGCGLPDAWRDRRRFVVGELGFGTGLNIAALLDLWRRDWTPGRRLHVFSVEAFPLERDEAARALAAFPEIAEAAGALLERWPGRASGFHRADLPWGATLDLAVAEAAEGVAAWGGRADAWFLDGFAPSANPGMWTPELLRLVAERSAPGARAATFTVAGAVRHALDAAGFEVSKRPGHGRKKQRLEAVLTRPEQGTGPAAAAASPGPRVAIVGAGIGGACVARALTVEGLRAVVVEAEGPGAGASGNPSVLVTPRLDAGGGVAAQLHAQAFARAAGLYRGVTGVVLDEGVLQLESGERDRGRFDKVARSGLFEGSALAPLDAEQATAWLGENSARAALWLEGGLTVDPAPLLRAWLSAADLVNAAVGRLERERGGWRLIDVDGRTIVEADVVCLCAGYATSLLGGLDLRPVRGQVSFAPGLAARAAAWGGYVAPAPGGLLFGATHDRGDASDEVREEDHRRNLAQLARARPGLAARLAAVPLAGRAGVRAAARDHLPAAGGITPSLFVLSGLGGRGFTLAPVLGEHVAALIAGATSPLPRHLAAAVDPQRLAAGTGSPGRSVAQGPS